MDGRFLVKKNKPSNYSIADRYFDFYKKDGTLLNPKRQRHDDDPPEKVIKFLDYVLDNAIRSYL